MYLGKIEMYEEIMALRDEFPAAPEKAKESKAIILSEKQAIVVVTEPELVVRTKKIVVQSEGAVSVVQVIPIRREESLVKEEVSVMSWKAVVTAKEDIRDRVVEGLPPKKKIDEVVISLQKEVDAILTARKEAPAIVYEKKRKFLLFNIYEKM